MKDDDFAAAMHEVETNLEVRRLMLVLTNVLTPACLMAVSDCLTGADPAPALRDSGRSRDQPGAGYVQGDRAGAVDRVPAGVAAAVLPHPGARSASTR